MDIGHVFLLLAVILVIALIAYMVWRNQRVKTSFDVGPIKVSVDTEREVERTAAAREARSPPATPLAQLEVGKIEHSSVINEGAGGGAKLKAGDITRSHVVNTTTTAGGVASKRPKSRSSQYHD